MNVAVLGGGEAVARAVAALPAVDTVTLLDAVAPRELAAALGGGAQAAAVAPGDREGLMLVLDGCALLVDATADPAAADAALTANVDLITTGAPDHIGEAFAAAGHAVVVTDDLAAAVTRVADGLVDGFGYPRTGRVDL